jgi:hypothetical protein
MLFAPLEANCDEQYFFKVFVTTTHFQMQSTLRNFAIAVSAFVINVEKMSPAKCEMQTFAHMNRF